MLSWISRMFSNDLAIDLGTANTLIYKECEPVEEGRAGCRHGRRRAKGLGAGRALCVCLGLALTACAHATGDPPASSGALTLPIACSAPRFYVGDLGNGWERTVIAFDCPRDAALKADH